MRYCEDDMQLFDTVTNSVTYEGLNYNCFGVGCPRTPFAPLPHTVQWFRKDIQFEVTNCEAFMDILEDNGYEILDGVATITIPWRYHAAIGRGSGRDVFTGAPICAPGAFGGTQIAAGYHNGGLNYNCSPPLLSGTCSAPASTGMYYSWWTTLDEPPNAPLQQKMLVFTFFMARADHLATKAGQKCFAVSRFGIHVFVSQKVNIGGVITVDKLSCQWIYCPPPGKPLDGTLCLTPKVTPFTSTCCIEWDAYLTQVPGGPPATNTCTPPLPCPCPRIQNFTLVDDGGGLDEGDPS